jgi:hypothetical protein
VGRNDAIKATIAPSLALPHAYTSVGKFNPPPHAHTHSTPMSVMISHLLKPIVTVMLKTCCMHTWPFALHKAVDRV